MLNKKYSNFVRSTSPNEQLESKSKFLRNISISGDEARRIYLEEVSESNNAQSSTTSKDNLKSNSVRSHNTKRKRVEQICDKDLFLAVQNNDVDTTIEALELCPDKINICDDYGWSLLMIACQANSIGTVKELLKRGVDTTVRDKAGNSAQSLVIQNKNLVLADILISYKHKREEEIKTKSKTKVKLKEFHCNICRQTYPDEQGHLSSTVHNINASKDKKIPTNYAIPQTNRGYQIMLKVGWDRESGLGPEGTGKKYPIKAVQKKDRKGLGNVKKEVPKEETVKHKTRKSSAREYENNKKMEICFRREFY